MSFGFHRGLISALIMRLQQTGLRLEVWQAQLALAGQFTQKVDSNGKPVASSVNRVVISSEAARWVDEAVAWVLATPAKFEHMKRWEEDHPGQKPFPPVFAEEILRLLEHVEEDDLVSRVQEAVALAYGEMEF